MEYYNIIDNEEFIMRDYQKIQAVDIPLKMLNGIKFSKFNLPQMVEVWRNGELIYRGEQFGSPPLRDQHTRWEERKQGYAGGFSKPELSCNIGN